MKNFFSLSRRAAASLWRKASLPPLWRPAYIYTSAFLSLSDRWNAEKMGQWQLDELNRLLSHALQNCPGHERSLREYGFKGRLNSLDEISGLPFFTKDQLREDHLQFTARNYSPKMLKAVTSGGTTGSPTRFMVSARTYDAVFDAWKHAMWRRGGYSPRARSLDLTWAFSGDEYVLPSSESKRIFLSIRALDDGAIGAWWQYVKAFQPEFIIAFPSTASALAKLLPKADAMPEVRAILLASETLTDDQRDLILAAFPRACIFQWYGMSEMAGFASGCEHTDTFHHWPQSGIMELVDEDGKAVKEPGRTGEIVLTGFINYATPFIRYRTGDRGVLGLPCAHCGRANTVISRLEGRAGDYLIGKNGRSVTISALNFHSDEFRQVFAHQFVQDVPGAVTLFVVALPGFNAFDATAIRNLVADKVGDDIEVKMEVVTSIPRTARGKQQLIVQRCNLNRVEIKQTFQPTLL